MGPTIFGTAIIAAALASKGILIVEDERPPQISATQSKSGRPLGAGAKRAAEREARERAARDILYAKHTPQEDK